MIVIKDASFFYKNQIGIKNINIKIEKGQFICFIGPNGSGKSTLLKLIAGIYVFSEGEYYFNNNLIDQKFLNNKNKVSELYKHIGFIFQNSEIQLFNTSVYDEIAFGLKNLNLSDMEIDTRVNDCLSLLEIEKLKYRIPYHLSGGEQKLVAIASILAMNPDILILDEPFNGLSVKYNYLIKSILCDLNNFGKTIILSTHDFYQVKNLVDKVYLFSDENTIFKEMNSDIFNLENDCIEYLR